VTVADTMPRPATVAAGDATGAAGAPPLLEVRGLVKHYEDARGVTVRAVDGVDFTLRRGEVLGIVGESGCGKTTVGRTVMRLMDPTAGQILLEGDDIAAKTGRGLKRARRDIQMVFQDPYGSLNPRHKVGTIVGEPLLVHGEPNRRERVRRLLELVGLPAAAVDRYPHEFSGGQRQRIAIARALALDPKIVIADEPVSALDVSIQSQIINMIADLRRRLGLAMIFISHDLSVVRHVSDRIAVMYFGRIVEIAPAEQLFSDPRHPYTRALLSAIPKPLKARDRGGRGRRIVLSGELPDPANPPQGCSFHGRCPETFDLCRRIAPELLQVGEGRRAACHLVADPEAAAGTPRGDGAG